MIDWDRPVMTKGGHEFRLYAKDGDGTYSIHGAIKDREGWEAYSWSPEGKFFESGRESVFDLENIPEKREGWINVYPKPRQDLVHDSEETANRCADSGRIKCIHIEYEV